MIFYRKFNPAVLVALACFCCCLGGSRLWASTAIESGQYFTDDLTTNEISEMATRYTFDAQTNDTVIIRLGHGDGDPYPVFALYLPNTNGEISTDPANIISNCPPVNDEGNEYHLPVTNRDGWYSFLCSIPTNGVSNMTYNCSMLRMPHLLPSYGDTDVGNLQVGDSKSGTINVSSDLDAGFFTVTNTPCTVQVRMGQSAVNLVPNMQIYGPDGVLVASDFPTDYKSEITSTLYTQGVYTIVCADKFNAEGQYYLTMVTIPGSMAGTDKDFGQIVSGEKRTGTINQPGDLDIATFNAVSGDVINITMTKVDVDMIPVMEFYGSSANRIIRTTDVYETTAYISNYFIASNGAYSIICKDKEDRYNVTYTLEMDFTSNSPSLANLPPAPATVSASQGAFSNLIEVTWSSVSNAVGYDIWRSYGTNSSVQIVTNLAALVYDDYNVVTGAYYYYKLKSRNAYGVSSNFSTEVSGYCGTSTPGTVSRRVLLVGIDHYSSSYGPSSLTTCTNDVNGMRSTFFLGDPSNFWSSTNMTYYTDSQATRQTIQNSLSSLAAASVAGDIVVYVHSSHGGWNLTTPGGSNTYICTYDTDYTAAQLASDLTAFNTGTKVIIIIDACFSGGMYRLKDDGKYPEWNFASETMSQYRALKAAQYKKQGLAAPKTIGDNIAFMTACDYDESSWTSDFYSRYIGYLIQGCNVQSVDTNNSGQYSFLELHNYAATNSAAESPAQHATTYHSSILDNTIARAVGSNAAAVSTIRYNDFDGDAYSDLAVYNAASGAWRIGSLHYWKALAWDDVWGGPGYEPINGDYDGDRATDAAVYNESQGLWSIASVKRKALILASTSFGGPALTPVAGDYNGDKIYDGALYQSPDGFWYIISSVGAPLVWGYSVAGSGFVPVSGDYDGDYISDLALYNSSQGYWYIISMNGSAITWGTSWGAANAVPISGDYDGDGYSDLGVYQESTGLWYVWSLKKQAVILNAVYFGGVGFQPVPGDYDGDGVCDMAVYQESTGNWYLRNVSGTKAATINLGGPGWIPVLPMW